MKENDFFWFGKLNGQGHYSLGWEGNIGEADSGIETRNPIWDMLSLRCCASKLKYPEGSSHPWVWSSQESSGWKNMDMRVICILINEVIVVDKFIKEESINMKRRKER